MLTELIDADRHVCEPISMWRDYLPKKYASFIPSSVSDNNEAQAERLMRLGSKGAIPLIPDLQIRGKPLFKNWGEALRIEASLQSLIYGEQVQSSANPLLQVKAMDAAGVTAAHLFPTYAAYIVNNENLQPDVSLAFARAYNNWLYDYCAHSPDRLYGVGIISRHDPDNMVQELEGILNLGWKSVVLRPEKILGRTLGHVDYAPFWAHCEAAGVAVAFHGGTHLHAPTVGSDRFNSRFALHACSHPMEAQMAFLALLEAGVLERHPKLKIAFLEAGASWLPAWLWRLDEICYKSMPGEVEERIKMAPSEYFKRQCWIGFEAREPCLRAVVDFIGAERLLYGTDFPHPDHMNFQLDDFAVDNYVLNQQELHFVFRENPRAFFGN